MSRLYGGDNSTEIEDSNMDLIVGFCGTCCYLARG